MGRSLSVVFRMVDGTEIQPRSNDETLRLREYPTQTYANRDDMSTRSCRLCLHGTTATALPTAEGAVQVAMEELPITLHSARVLILGFGRVGKLTAHRMGALGAKVTVSAQSYEDLAWAAAYGYETDRLEDLAWELGGFDLVVNTIPAPVLDERRLRWVAPGAFLLDLASAPGGIDRAAAQRRNLQVLQAPGLPGRVAPVTAAAAIRDAVYHILWEQEA